ncbi:hypothetical protein GCM10009555_016220 [Acrocarpospora macrocephala]
MVPPPQVPWSAQTPVVPGGASFWVHHLACQLWPLWETIMPPVYTELAFHGVAQAAAAAGEDGRIVASAPAISRAANHAMIRCLVT